MSKPTRTSSAYSSIISDLAEPRIVSNLGLIAARFIYSLRLIALHERVKRDPVPELTVRLHGVEMAAKSLALSHTIAAVWPENVRVSRFCCQRLTYDEATIGALLDMAWKRDRAAFDAQIAGFIRPERGERLWDDVLGLLTAEANAA